MIRGGIRRAFHLALRRRDRWEDDVEEEIKLHLALRAESLVARGASNDEAYAEAVSRFGPLAESRARMLDAARHRETRMQRTEYLSDLRQDVGFALRTLARQKSWTAVTIFTFALGIGASTAVFSVVSRLLLHPVDYPDAGRVVSVVQQPANGNNTGIHITITPQNDTYRAWRAGARSFDAMVAYTESPVTLKTIGEPTTHNAARIVPEFPAFAGLRPIAGRMFTDADIERDPHVVLVSEPFWRQQLGADQSALGKLVTLNDSLYTIIGVLPSALRLPGNSDLAPTSFWLPLDVRDDGGLAVLARLRKGATPQAAERELDSLFSRAANLTGDKVPFRAVVARIGDQLSFRDSLIMLTAAVALVLLIACANVMHLLIARGASRQRELAIRAALGAGRGRLLRQLTTESLLISVIGAGLGVAFGLAALKLTVALRPDSLSRLDAARLDGTTLGAALFVTVASAVVFGAVGLFQSSRHSGSDTLKTGAVGRAPRLRARGRGVLVVTEMALSATLLVGATMLVRSVIHLERADLGFDPANLYQVFSPLPKAYAKLDTNEARRAYLEELVVRVRHAGGVASATLATTGPGSRNFAIGRLEIDGEPPPPASTTQFIEWNDVKPNFFQAMGIAVVRGSTFTDTTKSSRQVVVNEGFARKHWPDGTALGHRLRVVYHDDTPWWTIVGVARDASTSGAAAESTAPIMYSPFFDTRAPTLLVRTNGDSAALSRVRAILLDATQRRTVDMMSVSERMRGAIAGPRFTMLLLTTLTLLALLLAGVGLYGVMAFIVMQQTREIGIRIALGATHSRVARVVLLRGATLAAIGIVIGAAVSRWGTHLIESQLYGVTRSDPASFVIGTVVLMGGALLACVVPTRRALAVDPMTAIRAD